MDEELEQRAETWIKTEKHNNPGFYTKEHQLIRDLLAALTREPEQGDELTERYKRAGKHTFEFAKKLGWKDDGEGAFEFAQRISYKQGLDDAGEVEHCLEIAIGDILYLAHKAGKLDRFQGTIDKLQLALSAMPKQPVKAGEA